MTPILRTMPLLLAGLLLLSPYPVDAQLGTPDTGAPMNIQSDSGIEWQQSQQLYIARGNATASRGPATIKADTLIAHYRKTKSPTGSDTDNNSNIYRIEADGNVVISRDNRTVVGDHADYDMDQGLGIVRGKALKMTTPSDVVTAKDAFEWYDQKQIAVARGDAVATRQGGRTIKADILTVHMIKGAAPAGAAGQPAKPGAAPAKPAPAKPGATRSANAAPSASGPVANNAVANSPAAKNAAGNNPKGSGDSKISRIDAQGHVVIVNGPDIGRGDYGVYNAVTDLCTLLGNVTVARGNDVITGQYAVMDLNTNISRIMPASTLPGSTRQRVQGLFVKQDVPGAPKKGP